MKPLPAHSKLLTEQACKLRLSATLEINELVQERLEGGERVVHLGFGEATFPIQHDILEAHRQASTETRYLPVAGLMKLRQRVAQFQSRRLDCPISPEQVLIAPGSKPLLFALFDILRGDVLLPCPSWVSYEPQVLHAGTRVFWIQTDEEDRHTISEQSLKSTYDQAIAGGGDPRVMLINSPSNPTGQVFSETTIETITRFCREQEITLISDEIYSDICYDTGRRVSPCAGGRFDAGRMILTGGLSKTYSAGGWRVGFAIFPGTPFGETVQKAVAAYASECWSAASAPAQEAAAVAFDISSEMDIYRQQVTLLHQQCTTKLFEALRDCGLAVPKPKGAFYVYPSFHPFTGQLESLGIRTSLELSRWLVEECGIAALPGSAFGEDDAAVAVEESGTHSRGRRLTYTDARANIQKQAQGTLPLMVHPLSSCCTGVVLEAPATILKLGPVHDVGCPAIVAEIEATPIIPYTDSGTIPMTRHHRSQTGRKTIRVFQDNVGKIPQAHDCALALADTEQYDVPAAAAAMASASSSPPHNDDPFDLGPRTPFGLARRARVALLRNSPATGEGEIGVSRSALRTAYTPSSLLHAVSYAAATEGSQRAVHFDSSEPDPQSGDGPVSITNAADKLVFSYAHEPRRFGTPSSLIDTQRKERQHRYKRLFRVFQANVGKNGPSHDCALALADAERYEVILLQEPWTQVRNSRCLTKTHPAYDTYSPVSTWEDIDTRPRVMTYIRRGSRLIASWASENDLSLLNPIDTPTNAHGNTIDLAFSNIALAQATVEDHLATSSGHFTLSISLPALIPAKLPKGKILLATDDELKRYTENMEDGIATIPAAASTPGDLDLLANAIIDLMQTAARAAGRESQRQPTGAPWWNEECIAVVRRARRTYWRNLINGVQEGKDIFKVTRWLKSPGVSATGHP
ncbi:hypothetical protein Purlil1_12845 [Purpureocillium lilacinum]|uniref:Aminotransferase class I/classII large domain-containing protein n=1 Tax=Purpureocillium lilacinum TaxID=33203 RepID=A0ABR0BFS8_PURLI|nr:hypothetical protein Purlil1_12845 [Purpureocillium lilacinum]